MLQKQYFIMLFYFFVLIFQSSPIGCLSHGIWLVAEGDETWTKNKKGTTSMCSEKNLSRISSWWWKLCWIQVAWFGNSVMNSICRNFSSYHAFGNRQFFKIISNTEYFVFGTQTKGILKHYSWTMENWKVFKIQL